MKIAVLGLGLMGSAFAEGMLDSGHEVIVYNRTMSKTKSLVEKGAVAVATASEAILQADASILVLTDGKAVESLLTEEVLLATRGKKVLNASTTGILEIMDLSEKVKKHEGSLSEISIMVGPDQLINQQGYFLLGCPSEEEMFWNDILSKMGTVQKVGELSSATKAESPIVFASAFSSIMLSYIGAVALKLNIPHEVVMQTVGGMVPGAEYILPNMLNRNYDQCTASTNSLIGVVDSAATTAKQVGIPDKIFMDMKELLMNATQQGYGEKDASSVVEILLENK